MNQELLWAYGFNLIINSALSFLTVTLFVMVGTWIFRVKDPRLKSIFLCIPFSKLIFDLFLYDFTNWGFNDHLNPLEAEPGSRMLSIILNIPGIDANFIPLAAGIQMFFEDGRSFTLADILFFCIQPFWLKIAVMSAATVSLSLIVVWAYHFYRSIQTFHALIQNSGPCRRSIFNPSLNDMLYRKKVDLRISTEIEVPCAVGIFKKKIVFPSNLVHHLSQEEFEAIVAHELHHLNWHDCAVRLISRILGILFWWIPTGWLLSRIEQSQEAACDHAIRQYQISSVDLASAIFHTAQWSKQSTAKLPHSVPCFISPAVSHRSLTNRIQTILKDEAPRKKLIVKNIFAVIAMSAIFFGKFWIF